MIKLKSSFWLNCMPRYVKAFVSSEPNMKVLNFKVFITSPDHANNMTSKYANKFVVFFPVNKPGSTELVLAPSFMSSFLHANTNTLLH